MFRSLILIALLALPACRGSTKAPTGPARAVADWFVDKHYVEANQRRALEVTRGGARAAIEKELGLLEGFRDGATPPKAAHQRVYWERVEGKRLMDADIEVEHYRLSIDAGSMKIEKRLRVSLSEVEGVWKVLSFVERDLEPDEE